MNILRASLAFLLLFLAAWTEQASDSACHFSECPSTEPQVSLSTPVSLQLEGKASGTNDLSEQCRCENANAVRFGINPAVKVKPTKAILGLRTVRLTENPASPRNISTRYRHQHIAQLRTDYLRLTRSSELRRKPTLR